MKPIILAKNVWNHATGVQKSIGGKPTYKDSAIYSYYGILSMYAAAQASYYGKDQEWFNEVLAMLERYPFEFEDPSIYFDYNFDNYRVGGLGKAWLCMKGYFDEEHKEMVRLYAEKTLAAPRTGDGIICHPRNPEAEQIWIDVVYAVTPYMLYAGILFKEQKYIDFAVSQCFKMYDAFMDPSNGLLHQSRGFMGDKTTVSEDHWSRGNGWGYIGLIELIRYLPEDSEYRKEAIDRYIAHSEAILKYQDHRGLWRQSMAEPLAWEESSGTGIFLYGFGVGLRLGLLDKDRFMPAFQKGLDGLIKYCINSDYSTEKCCCGCLCPGMTPERRGKIEAYLVDVEPRRDEGHSFGPIFLALTEAARNGIINIEFKK